MTRSISEPPNSINAAYLTTHGTPTHTQQYTKNEIHCELIFSIETDKINAIKII